MQTKNLRDEVFLQLIKQLRVNNNDESAKSVWTLFNCLASCCSPSQEFQYPLLNWLLKVIEKHEVSYYKQKALAVFCKVYKGYQLIVRRTFPATRDQCESICNNKKLRCIIHLQNGAELGRYMILNDFNQILEIKLNLIKI